MLSSFFWGSGYTPRMRTTLLLVWMSVSLTALGQRPLPPLVDGTVINENSEFRQDGPLHIAGRVKLQGISLDLRGPITLAAGAEFELEDVKIKVSDPPASANGTSSLSCEGPARIKIAHSTMDTEGSAHPIWRLRGEVAVNDFQTTNSEFHLDRVQAHFENLKIFELEISNASRVIGRHLSLVFLSTHTGDAEQIEFSDIPADRQFSKKLRMGSDAEADLTETSLQLFLLYVHGRSEVTLSRIGRAQLSIAPQCHGTFKLPHGMVGSAMKPVLVPEVGASDCPFRFKLQEVNADTWDVYATGHADLTFTDSVIDELTAGEHAQVTVKNSEVYADWLSLGGDARLQVEHSRVGAQRLAAERPDLATSQVRTSGRSHASFEDVTFDCGVLAGDSSAVSIHNPVNPPAYLRRSGHAIVKTKPFLPVEDLEKRNHP